MTRVALVQVASPDEESQEARITRVEALLRSHAQEGIDLFVLPELWSAACFAFDHFEERAETFDGPTVAMCRSVARDLGAWVHLGSFLERDETGRLYNTSALIDSDGTIVQTYRKIHVFGYRSREAELVTSGDALSVVETPLGPLASTICYDLRFPGLWVEAGARGAHAAVLPAAWPASRRQHFRLFTETRAVEHQIWMIAVGACGTQSGVELSGISRIVSPWGEVVAECSPTEEEVVVADIDPGLVGQARSEFRVLGDRLAAEAYSALSRDAR